MTVGFLTSGSTDRLFEETQIRDALSERGVDAKQYDFIDVEDVGAVVHDGQTHLTRDRGQLDPEDYDTLFLIELGEITIESLYYRVYLLERFVHAGVEVVNPPSCTLLCRNKIAVHHVLSSSGLPTVESWVPPINLTDPAYPFERESSSVVVKPLLGSRGRDVVRCEWASVPSTVARLRRRGRVPVVQPVVPKRTDFDIRVLVVGNEVVEAVRRQAEDGSFVTNISKDATPEPFDPPARLSERAVRVRRLVDGRAVTVDFLPDHETETNRILEVNGFPRWYGRSVGTDLVEWLF